MNTVYRTSQVIFLTVAALAAWRLYTLYRLCQSVGSAVRILEGLLFAARTIKSKG